MQATSIIILPAAANGVDPAGESTPAGQGIRISSALQTKSRDSLFTSILQQGITLDASSVMMADSAGQGDALTDGTSDAADTAGDDTLDVCGLLMQLILMNPLPQEAVGTSAESGGLAAGTDVIAVTAGMDAPVADAALWLENPAADRLLNTGGTALEKLTELAASGNPAVTNGGPKETANGAGNGSVLASIAAAIENTVIQEEPASGSPAEGAGVLTAAASESAQQHTGRITAEANNTVGAAGMADGLKTSGTDGQSESGIGMGVREKSKTDDGALIGTAMEQRLNGTAFGDETAAVKTAAVEKALNSFAEDLVSLRGGAQELKIVLEPESLGVLTISVIKTETGISAKIKSEDRDVVAAVSEHLQKLVSTMENKGIRLNNIDVVFSQAEQNAGFDQNGFSRGGDGPPNNRYAATFGKNQEADASGGDFWQGFYSADTGGDTTVDYRV